MAINHIDDLTDLDLKPAYARIHISVEKVYVDEHNPPAEGSPSNVHLVSSVSEIQDLVSVNKALSGIGLAKVTDVTGTSPKIKTA